MTKEKKNSVRVISNAVLVRSEADSNRCIRFCRPLPSHSAIRPFVLSCRPPLALSSTSGCIVSRASALLYLSSLFLTPSRPQISLTLSTSGLSLSASSLSRSLSFKSPALPFIRAPRVGAEHGVGDVRPANIQKNIYLPKLRQIFDSFSEKYYFYSTVDAPATTQPHPRIRPVRLRGDTATADMEADAYVTTPYKYCCDATCGRLYETAANV